MGGFYLSAGLIIVLLLFQRLNRKRPPNPTLMALLLA